MDRGTIASADFEEDELDDLDELEQEDEEDGHQSGGDAAVLYVGSY